MQLEVEERDPLPTKLTVTVVGVPHPACWTMLPVKPGDAATMVTAGAVPVPEYFRVRVIWLELVMAKPVTETFAVRL